MKNDSLNVLVMHENPAVRREMSEGITAAMPQFCRKFRVETTGISNQSLSAMLNTHIVCIPPSALVVGDTGHVFPIGLDKMSSIQGANEAYIAIREAFDHF
jgi:hypothetical protein